MSDASSPEQNPLEGLIRPWFFPSLGLTVVVGVAVFWWSGIFSDSAVGAVLALVVPLVLAAMILRTAFTDRVDPLTRGLLVLAAVLAFAVPAIPSLEAVHPGEPHVVAEFSQPGEKQSVPPGTNGEVLLLVSTRLGGAAEPVVNFRLGGFDKPVEGELRRTTGFARVGRGGSAKVTRDHDADWFEAKLPSGAPEIRLEKVQGLATAPLRVEVYRDWLPHGVAWVLSVLVLALAAFAEARTRKESGAAIAAGVALGFGLVVSYNVTPARPVAPLLWAIVLGAIVGAPAAWLFRRVARMAVPAPQRSGRPGRGEE